MFGSLGHLMALLLLYTTCVVPFCKAKARLTLSEIDRNFIENNLNIFRSC